MRLAISTMFLAATIAFGYGTTATASIPEIEPRVGWEVPEEDHLPFYVQETPTDLEKEIGELKALTIKRWPDTYAGFWIIEGDPSRGVFVAFTRAAEQNVEDLRDKFSRPELIKPVTHLHSNNELNALLERVVDHRDLAAKGLAEIPGVNGNRMDVRVDEVNNRVDLIAPNPTADTVSHFAERFPEYSSEMLRVVKGPAMRPGSCLNRSRCGFALRSGLQSHNDYSWCSTAFAVTKPDADVPRQLLSAAHCGQDEVDGPANIGAPVWHGNWPGIPQDRYGWNRAEFQIGVLDVERHSVGNGFYTLPRIYGTFSSQQMPVRQVSAYNAVLIGAQTCKAGVSTGYTCGYVDSVNAAPWWVPNSAAFISSTACAHPGDSGSGVFWGGMALGVTSGVSDFGTCEGTQFSHIQFVEFFMGLSVDRVPVP